MRMQGRELTEFIDQLVRSLRSHDVPVSPEQIIDGNDIALMLLSRSDGEVDSDALMRSLAPIFCADPAEQAAFYEEFERLLDAGADRQIQAPGKPAKRPKKPKPPGIARKWYWRRTITKFAAFVILMVGAGLLIFRFLPEPPAPVVIDGPVTTPGGEGPALPPRLERPQQSAEPTLQIPPRPPATVELLRADQPRLIDTLIWLIVAIPLFWGLATLLRRIAGRRVFLSADRTRSHPDLKPIPIAEARVGLYAFSRLASAVTMLRLPKRRETRRLDARKTIEKTIRDGGFPSLVFETRSKRPGYVLLIERKNAIDFFAHAARSLADYLYGAGLEIHAFAFKGRPYRFMPLWRKGHRVTYQEILQRYHGDALVVAGDPGTIRRGNVAGANQWRPDVAAWSATGLLSSNACETWDQEEDWFLEKNFSVAAFGSEGFEEISTWLGKRDDGDDEPHFAWEPSIGSLYPRALSDNPERWLADEPQPDVDALLGQLKAYLGSDGMYLLAAISAYPELRWPIARFLNQELFTGGEALLGAEQRLLRIARLPWSREGKMPFYIRQAVLQSLNVEERQQIQSAFYSLLNDTHQADPEAPKIEIAAPGSKNFKEFLSEMLSTSPPGPYRDYIFQSVLLDAPKDMPGIELDRRRARQVGRQRWHQAIPDMLPYARRTAIWTAAVAFVAFAYLKPMTISVIEDRNILENGSISARVFYYSDVAASLSGAGIQSTNFLAKRVQWALEARGFNVELEEIVASPAQLQAMTAEEKKAEEPVEGSSRSFFDPPESPLNRPITPNFVFYDNLAGVSMIDQQVVPARDTLRNRASTRMQVFAGVIADEISHATYGQPVAVTPIDDADPNALLDIGQPGDAAYIDGPSEINILLAEDTRSFQDRFDKGGLGPVMNLIGPGTLTFAGVSATATRDPNPRGPVTVTFDRTFAIGKYEITFDEYDRYAAETESPLPDDAGWGRDRRPVISVSKANAEAYAAWLSNATGETYRLPTDAEWEYAARAGLEAQDGTASGADEANFAGVAGETLVAGGFAASAWGLHDVQGNVAEWVSDCWNPAPGAPGGRVDRGGRCFNDTIRNGSWQDNADEISLKTNRSVDRDAVSNAIGFRLVREFEAAAAQQETGDPKQDTALEEASSYE